MFKLPSEKTTTSFLGLKLSLICCLFFAFEAQGQFRSSKGALIDAFIDEQFLMAYSESDDWDIGEILPIISQN